MRILVLGRFITALAILTACLCLLPASTQVASARPIGWEDVGPKPPPDPGDNDTVVLKAPSVSRLDTGTQTPGGRTVSVPTFGNRSSVLAMVRWYFAVMRLDYWSFLLR